MNIRHFFVKICKTVSFLYFAFDFFKEWYDVRLTLYIELNYERTLLFSVSKRLENYYIYVRIRRREFALWRESLQPLFTYKVFQTPSHKISGY